MSKLSDLSKFVHEVPTSGHSDETLRMQIATRLDAILSQDLAPVAEEIIESLTLYMNREKRTLAVLAILQEHYSMAELSTSRTHDVRMVADNGEEGNSQGLADFGGSLDSGLGLPDGLALSSRSTACSNESGCSESGDSRFLGCLHELLIGELYHALHAISTSVVAFECGENEGEVSGCYCSACSHMNSIAKAALEQYPIVRQCRPPQSVLSFGYNGSECDS